MPTKSAHGICQQAAGPAKMQRVHVRVDSRFMPVDWMCPRSSAMRKSPARPFLQDYLQMDCSSMEELLKLAKSKYTSYPKALLCGDDTDRDKMTRDILAVKKRGDFDLSIS